MIDMNEKVEETHLFAALGLDGAALVDACNRMIQFVEQAIVD